MEGEIIEEVPIDEVETIEQGVDIRDMEDVEEEYSGVSAHDVQPESKMYRSFKCHICKVYFTRLHTLKSHISTHHPELDWNDLYRTTTFKCGEGSCKYIGKTRTDLLGHLYQEHDFLLHKVEGEFVSTDDFTVFFEKLQKVCLRRDLHDNPHENRIGITHCMDIKQISLLHPGLKFTDELILI